MKPVFIAALALAGLSMASQPALAQDDGPRQLGGAPVLPAPATRPATPAPQQLGTVPAVAPPTPAAPVRPSPAATAADSARQPAAAVAEPIAPPPAGTSPFNRPYVMGGSTQQPRFQVGLKSGQVYSVTDVQVKSPLFGRSHLLLDGQQRIDLAEVGFYEDQTGHYVRTTLPNSNRETTLRREKTGRISLYATYNTSYASSPYGMGMGMGGFGYGGYPYGGFGNPYGGYRTTKTEYFSKDNGPVQNLNLRNLAVATSENAGAQQLLSNARRYRQSTIAAYVVGGGLLVAGLVQSTRPTGSNGISPLFYAAIPVLIVPLIFQSKQAEAQRQAIALYNSGRQ